MPAGCSHRLIEQSGAETTIQTLKLQEGIELMVILLKSHVNVVLGGVRLVTSCTESTPGLHCPAD